MSLEIRNIVQLNAVSYDCEYRETEDAEWEGYTVVANDSEYLGKLLYDEIISGRHGEATPYVPSTVNLRKTIESQRKAAYANPYTGSDRLFAEAQRMQLMGETGWEDVRDQAVARFNEIQALYPWPNE